MKSEGETGLMAIARGSLALVALGCVVFLAACAGGKGEGTVKKEAGRVIRISDGKGGQWFPEDKTELQAMVNGFIEEAEVPEIKGRIVGVISPHAGYRYSGRVAGYAFRAAKENAKTAGAPETVVVLGFTHRESFAGVALMDGDAIKTPLGESALDAEAARILTGSASRIALNYAPHELEHSAENEIPFVQAAFPQAKIVVGLIGDHDAATIKELVAALTDLAKKKRVLVVASSDMLHDPDYDLVTKTDKATLSKVAAMDYAGVVKTWSLSKQIFCGIMPVATIMQFAEAQGCKKASVLHYRNNGDDDPSSRGHWVVGYGAVAFAVEK